MEEILNQNGIQEPSMSTQQQVSAQVDDNSQVPAQNEGQAAAPSESILGKFKSVEDLSKAYKELEKLQGSQANEIGAMRQDSEFLKCMKDLWGRADELKAHQAELNELANKHSEYFQNTAFRNLYKEAYLALGQNLDTDALINLVESYAQSRINTVSQSKAAKNETRNIIDSMSFNQNPKSSFNPPKKRLDEMTPQEVDELLDQII